MFITGDSAHAPMHATTSRLNSLSRVVLPGSILRCFVTVSSTFAEPFTWHAVPRQTITWYLPFGWNRNWL